MAKIKVAEIFYSLQGEGLWLGVPSVFLRTFGCNFQCRGFGMPNGEKSTEPEEFAEQFKIHPEWEYTDLPLAKTGCDSYASWHPAFKSLSPMLTVEEVVDGIERARRGGGGHLGTTHLVITGGEPLLGWQRAYPELLDLAFDRGYQHITLETNGTQAISDDFANYLLIRQIKNAANNTSMTFSVSPKLYMSGEDGKDALKPEIVADYQKFGTTYLKYVVANKHDMEDVLDFTNEYRKAGFTGEVFLMPCGGDTELYNINAQAVAEMAKSYGFRYSPRLQVDLWQNAWWT